MVSTSTVRYALMCTMLAFLACGEGPGGAQDTIPGEAANTSGRDDLRLRVICIRLSKYYLKKAFEQLKSVLPLSGRETGWNRPISMLDPR